ncbi:hypothetical protein SPHINGOT1_80189 [Sphingomonas sp. T1]|uniref:hypothetical protein n=1 Tax=Sphingomonas sp. T1 TaxID=2653172 RepID=UPI0012F43EC5|nr:hypothetical protein [Sphingomonas sp. T1]VXD07692.1 hypothetical protein SPHINGOT1_80189 [Sphingomonas sp. T1]
MRVVTDTGSIELGTIESSPMIGITDYSRRTTDEFGVTTVVKRSFARQMSVRLAVPSAGVDALQRQLADLRATSATWIGDDPYGNLTVRGFYKNFEVDHPTSLISYCTLTIEGLTGEAEFTDGGTDPAPGGKPSTLQVLQPIAITDAVLISSTVAEDDAIEWSPAGGYPAGTRVVRRGTHRVYESIIASNIGNDPALTVGAWLDVGPTNRWAMFDQAIGSTTTDDNVITVALRPGPAVSGLAILDTNAARVRVQAPGYDRTVAVTGGATSALFLDLATTAGASLTVTLTAVGNTAQRVLLDDAAPFDDAGTFRDTVAGTASAEPPAWDDSGTVRDTTAWHDTRAGDGAVSVGTLMVGILWPLGRTGSSPTSSITDYSKRETDDFGEIAIVPRAWAKRMAAKALIRTDAVNQVIGRVAAVRAVPSLWVADRATESLTVYGFFKEVSVEVGQSVSTLSLSIEGFSEAATPAPLTIPWEHVSDPDGTKPTDGADKTGDNTSKDTGAVAGVPATQVIADAASVKQRSDILENITIPAINSAVAAANALIKTAGAKADAALADLNAKLLASGIVLDAALANADSKLAAARVTADLAVSRANTRIDAAMTDLNAEANRAQGKDELLDRRIDSLTVVTNKNDGEVRALIETERLVRTDDVRAIAQRIDTVVTDYTSRDSVTNTRITTTITALSAADGALGERIDTVTTEFKAADSATSTRITDSVAALSAADEAIGKRVDSIVTDVTTKDTATRAEISRVELASSTRDTALGQRIDTVVTDYTGRDSATNTRITTQVTALSAADKALGERIDTVTTEFKAADAATSARITDSITSLSDADAALGRRIDSIVAEGGFDDTAVRSEITRVETASASRDSALGSRIDTIATDYQYLDSATNTRITQTATALSNADAAIGRRIDTVTTDYKGLNTSTNTRISTEVAALSDADTSIGQRIDSLIAQGGGGSEGVDTVARAEISRVETAGVTRDNALGSRIDTVTASIGPAVNAKAQELTTAFTNADLALTNRQTSLESAAHAGLASSLIGNANFASWPDGSPLPFGWASWFQQVDIQRITSTYAGAGYAARLATQAGQQSGMVKNPIGVQPGWYVMEADAELVDGTYQGAGLTVDGYYSVNFAADPDLNEVVSSGGSTRRRWSKLFYSDRPLVNFHVMSGWTGFGEIGFHVIRWYYASLRPASEGEIKAQKAAATLIPALSARISTTENTLTDLPNRYATAQRVSILEAQVSGSGGDLTAKIDERLTVVVDPKIGAVAQSVSDLRSAYNGTAATVSQQAGTLADVKGRTAAYWRTTAVAGNNRAQITISADANAGAGVDIIGDVSISGSLLVTGSVITDRIAVNGVTNTVAIAGMSGGVSPEDTGETGRVYITSTGGTMKVDVQADGTRTGGSGNMRAQLFAAYNGTELALSREVAFTPSNTAVPVGFFQIIQFPAGTAVQFFLRFFVTTTNTTWTYTSAAIAVTEFKR